MKPGETVHMTLPGQVGERFLHRCVVLEVRDDRLTVSLAQPDLPIEAEMDVILFFDFCAKFMQQVARVEAVQDLGSVRMVDLNTVSDPMSAEKRQDTRVATTKSNAWVNLDSNLECMVRDASVSGFSVVSPDRYSLSQVVFAELNYAGRKYTGHASVRNIRELSDGRSRYGLYCLSGRGDGNDLKTGLRELTLATKHQQGEERV